jgi:hypothetical protein
MVMLQQVEHWPDPLTGEKLERRLLGSCSSGMLVTRPARQSSGIDLYWAGADPAGQLDWQLQHTIENYRRPPPGELAAALPTRIKGLWWLCRARARCLPGRG